MKKPRYYMIHQLKLDIQARSGLPADRMVLLFGDRELLWHQRLCTVDLQDWDVLKVQLKHQSWESFSLKQDPTLHPLLSAAGITDGG